MSTQTLLTVQCGCALLAAFAVLWSMYAGRQKRKVLQRLNTLIRHQATERGYGFREGILRFLYSFQNLRKRWRIGLAEEGGLRMRLARAGFRHAQAPEFYLALRTLGPVVALLLGSFCPSRRQFWLMALPGLAYLLPDLLLRRLIRLRAQKIGRGLPDAVDLMVICVEAGLGIDQALVRVSQELGGVYPEIMEEFTLVNLEQRAGKARLQAWQDMADRVALEEMSSFVGMLVQTERFGTPIAKALNTFANGLRERRGRKAEEMAAKVTVKIIFPLALFIFPSIFIVLLGPAVLTLMRNLGALTH